MKRVCEIIGWSVFGILMVLSVPFGIACILRFIPSTLTPIARVVAGNFVTCEYEIGKVDVTLFSTFPRVGVQIDRLVLINPVEGAPNDTVLAADRLTATVNIKQLIFDNNLIINDARLDRAFVNYYVAQDGTSNFDFIVSSPPDTTAVEDTTAFSLPFNTLRVDGLHLHTRAVSYIDEQAETYLSLAKADIAAAAADWNEMYLRLRAQDVCAQMEHETYASHAQLALDAPLHVQLDSMRFGLNRARLALNEFAMTLDGTIVLSDTLDMDLRLMTDEKWAIEPLLAILPHSWVESVEEFKPAGTLKLDAVVCGQVSDTRMPVVTVNRLNADLWHSRFDISGQITNMASDMCMDVNIGLDLPISDFKQFIPEDITIDGRMKGTVNTTIKMSDLEKGVLSRAKMDLTTNRLHVAMDTTLEADLGVSAIHLQGTQLLADQGVYKLNLTSDFLDGRYDDIKADMNEALFELSLVGGKRIRAKLKADTFDGRMGEETTGRTQALSLEAAAMYNKNGENLLLQWNPRVGIRITEGVFNAPDVLPEILYVPSIDFSYSNREMIIDSSRIEIGNSDLGIQGHVRQIGAWLRHEDTLEGELDISSDHCDANQLLAWLSADSGSEEVAEEPVKTSDDQPAVTNDSVPAKSEPFLVPTDVNLSLRTHMHEVDAFNQHAKNLHGGIFLKSGILILDEVGFVCKAAKLQLTAMYRTPRRNHIYAGFDYHMVDVDIDELFTMIPNLEDMVPMLRSFKGEADFHLAAETYLTSQYQPKMSTLRGAASLTGKDLVVLDGETFDKISKLLLFSKKTENRIDSLNAEITIYKNQIDVYPLCVQMDNYMVALGGRHNTNMTFNYDINVLKPIYLGVNISGTPDDLQIKLVKCKFAQDFRPHWYQKADNQSRELRERIKQSMEKNVRIK